MLMIRIENCPDICVPIVNVLTSPLINLSDQIWFGRSNAKVDWKMSDDWPSGIHLLSCIIPIVSLTLFLRNF